MNENRGLWRGKINDELHKEQNGEWIEGDLLCDKDSYGSMSYGIAKRDDFVTVRLVDPDTLGECMSLTDKNGVKIFEGDMLKINYVPKSVVAVIKYDEFYAGFVAVVSEHLTLVFGADVDNTFCEVIGNIHDNPELLEVERND